MSRDKDSAIFQALADSRRRKILDLIREKPKTTGDICKHFRKIDRCTVMQHLDVLEKAGLAANPPPQRRPHQRGREIYERWISRYSQHAARILTRIKHDLES